MTTFRAKALAVFKRHTYGLLLLGACGIGIVGGFLGLDRSWILTVVSALALFSLLAGWVKNAKREDPGAWQRKIDREYRLDISESTITLYRNEAQEIQFDWMAVKEIQLLWRQGSFPPLFWKIITRSGSFEIPNGGSYARIFEEQFIYALPDYHDQMVVKVPVPAGYTTAQSMWRQNDPHPKRERTDEDQDDWW